MNAPARAPSREDYEPTVRAFMPSADGEELELRCALLLIRDCSLSAKRHCSEEAWSILDHVERLCSLYAFRGLPLAELAELRAQLMALVRAASALDAIFAPQLPLSDAANG